MARGAWARILAMVLLSMTLVGGVAALLRQAPQAGLDVARYRALPGLASLPALPALPQLPGSPPGDAASADSMPASIEGEEAERRNAGAPFLPLGPAAPPFHFSGAPADHLRARSCLAAAMFYEAGDDGLGQLVVGQVVLNRVRHPAFPNDVCGVVAQGSERRTGCQFTFTCDGSLARIPSPAARARALVHADLMLNGLVFAGAGLATHYHTVGVYPWWSPKLEKIARVGAHLFFRWPGDWGSAKVLRSGSGPERITALFARFDAAPMPVDGAEPRIEPEPIDGTDDRPSLAGTIVRSANDAARSTATLTDARIPSARRLPDMRMAPVEQPGAVMAAGPLGGHRLLRMFPDEGVFFIQIAQGSTQASRRRAADLLCGGRAKCLVYGWLDASEAPSGPKLDGPAHKALAFTFARQPVPDPRSLPPSTVAF